MDARHLDAPVEALLRTVGAEVHMAHFGRLRASDIREKTPGDPVTIVDREAEARLGAALSQLLPGTTLVGEEAAAADPAVLERIDAGLCWIIDPLDGTANYAAGHGPFGIILALAERGETIAGWLYDPVSGRLCHAHRGAGAWIDGIPVRARPSGEAFPVAAISTLFIAEDRRDAMHDQGAGRVRFVDVPRCAAEQYPRIVTGINDITTFERVLPWDHAAGVLFVEEAGGRAARPDGSAYRPGDRANGLIAAASPELWDLAAAIFVG